jgi:ATP-dependent DNA ligase
MTTTRAKVPACSGRACAMGLEGIVSKRGLSPYKSGPSKFWLKIKNVVESDITFSNESRSGALGSRGSAA